MRKAKIICTLGPASKTVEVLEQMIAAGMNVARLNFSHGTHEAHAELIKNIRAAAEKQRSTVALLADLQGPRIRIGDLQNEVTIDPGQAIVLVPEGEVQVEGAIPVTHRELFHDLGPGARILIDDGLIELRVETVNPDRIEATVVIGGKIKSHKGMNFPATRISVPALTEKDREDLAFALENQVDFVALSFVQDPEDVLMMRELINQSGHPAAIIAKIESEAARVHLEKILEVSDGIMVARGDLGVELGPEAVPLLQKHLITAANQRGKIVITATQMLESMVENSRPTRAEASDVANAVLDGSDALMLSAETATGANPVAVVRVMDRLMRAAEAAEITRIEHTGIGERASAHFPEAVCEAAASAAQAVGAQIITVFTESGATAGLMAKQRPHAPIIAFTPHELIRRRLVLYWGVTAYIMPDIHDTDERIFELERRLKEEGLANTGDRIVIVSGAIVGQPGGTNLLKLHALN